MCSHFSGSLTKVGESHLTQLTHALLSVHPGLTLVLRHRVVATLIKYRHLYVCIGNESVVPSKGLLNRKDNDKSLVPRAKFDKPQEASLSKRK